MNEDVFHIEDGDFSNVMVVFKGVPFFTYGKFYHHFSRDVRPDSNALGKSCKNHTSRIGSRCHSDFNGKNPYFVSKLGDRHKFVRRFILAENPRFKSPSFGPRWCVWSFFFQTCTWETHFGYIHVFYIFGSRINVQYSICNESSAYIECAWWEWWIHGQCSFLCHVARCHVCLWNHTSTSSSSHESRRNWIAEGKQGPRLFL